MGKEVAWLGTRDSDAVQERELFFEKSDAQRCYSFIEPLYKEESLAVSRLKGIRQMMGFVENGSNVFVKFSQDGEKEFCLTVGNKYYFANSFEAVLDIAIAAESLRRD